MPHLRATASSVSPSPTAGALAVWRVAGVLALAVLGGHPACWAQSTLATPLPTAAPANWPCAWLKTPTHVRPRHAQIASTQPGPPSVPSAPDWRWLDNLCRAFDPRLKPKP